MGSSKKTLIFFVSEARFLVSHRLNLIKGAVAEGYRVVVACPDAAAVSEIRNAQAEWVEWKIDRGGISVASEFMSLVSAFRIIRSVKPNVIHAITIKCILHAGLASKILRVPLVGAVSGLGYVYTGKAKGVKGVLRRIINASMKLGLNRRNVSMIFQNCDDARMIQFVGLNLVSVHMIGGSGVDLDKISMKPHPEGPTTVIGLPARLLRYKGIEEFVEAAREIRRRGRDARFLLIGDPDLTNPSSVTPQEIEIWTKEGVVEWVPYTSDIATALSQLHIVALPSYYREGFPKTIIDASAAGRVSVTSDAPGCRDAIVDGETGLLSPVRNVPALTEAFDTLIQDRIRCVSMGHAARAHAEAFFDIRDVTEQHLAIYRLRANENSARQGGAS